MSKRKRIFLIITGVLILIIIILSIYANSIAKNKIEALLKEKVPAHIELNYKDLSVHILRGSVSIKNPSINIKVKDSALVHTELKMKSFVVGGISYWGYLMNDKIHIRRVKLNELDAVYYKDRVPKLKDTITKEKKAIPSIIMDAINLNKANITIYDGSKDSTLLTIQNADLTIKEIQLETPSKSDLIPFKYSSINLESDAIFYKAGKYENIEIDHLLMNDHDLEITGFQYKTKYSKKEYSKILSIERDYYDVYVSELKLNDATFGKLENDTVYFKTNLINVNKANAAFYRDKLIADDLKIKKLYSQSIRELPIKLTIDSISITNSMIEYSEKVHKENPAGILTIKDINAGITNISNTYLSPEKTEINVKGTYMKDTPIDVKWTFDVNNTSDTFKFVGQAGKLELSDMNVFLTPLLNAEVNGIVKETYFVINGDYNQSVINLSQDYKEIDLIILNKKKTKNKILSSVANTFIHKESAKKGSLFHNATTQATRDKTKSFFNYLAKNLKNGLLVNFTSKNNKVTKQKKSKKQ